MMTDPIADMLTRIRNAGQARHSSLAVPASKVKLEIARILKEEGYIKNYKMVRDNPQGTIKIQMKYGPGGKPVFRGLRRVSKPGWRVYRASDELASVYGGLGVSIVTTSRGLMTERQCRERNVGGEVLCEIW